MSRINLYRDLHNIYYKALGNILYYCDHDKGNIHTFVMCYQVSSSIVYDYYLKVQQYIKDLGLNDYINVAYIQDYYQEVKLEIKKEYIKDENFLETLQSLIRLKIGLK